MKKLTPNETRILAALRADARAQFAALARETRIPASTIMAHYKALRPVMRKHSALLRYPALRHGVHKIFLVLGREQFVRRAIEHPATNNAYRTSRGHVLEAVFPDLAAAHAYRELFDGMRFTEHDVLEEIGRENAALPN